MHGMPTYEYACTACGERTEAKQKFTDPPLETCPVCGGKLRKLYSPVGIVFKGSGFYSTDARSDSKKPAGKGAADKGEGKAEAKPGDKSDTKAGSGSGTSDSKASQASKAGSSSSSSGDKG
jgi:putative FmdB family regulatory protein